MERFRFIIAMLVCLLVLPTALLAQDEEPELPVTVFGLVDVRVGFFTTMPEAEGLDDESRSDAFVRFAGIGAAFAPNEYVSSTFLFMLEDVEEMYLDEGFIRLQYPMTVTPYLALGRLYVPTNSFATYAIDFPLTQTLFEVNETAVGAGLSYDYIDLSFWLFDGGYDNVDEDGEPADDVIDTFAANVVVTPLTWQDTFDLAVGGFYLSDATETDYEIGATLLGGNYEADIPAYGAFLNAELPINQLVGIGLVGEYAATSVFEEQNYLDNTGEETQITATNVELALLFIDKTVQLGGKYEGVQGLDWLGMQGNDPDYEITTYTRFGGFVGVDPWPWLHVGARYMAGVDNEGNRDNEVLLQTMVEY